MVQLTLPSPLKDKIRLIQSWKIQENNWLRLQVIAKYIRKSFLKPLLYFSCYILFALSERLPELEPVLLLHMQL